MNLVIQLSPTFYGGIGVFGLILASIGLAGVTAYAVARRTREIGIRMALGATTGQVLRLVMQEGAALVAAGTVLGFAGAVLISRALSAMTAELARAFGASTGDPFLLIGAPLLLAGLASWPAICPRVRPWKSIPSGRYGRNEPQMCSSGWKTDCWVFTIRRRSGLTSRHIYWKRN